MEKNNNQMVAESQNKNIKQSEKIVEVASSNVESKSKGNKKPLTPYQKYKNSRNQNGKKYFDFYDDIKVYTHNIWDW